MSDLEKPTQEPPVYNKESWDVFELNGSRTPYYRYNDKWLAIPDLIRTIIREEKEKEEQQ